MTNKLLLNATPIQFTALHSIKIHNKLQSLKQKCSVYCTEKVDEIY